MQANTTRSRASPPSIAAAGVGNHQNPGVNLCAIIERRRR